MDELYISLPGAFSLKQGRLERMIQLLQPLFDLQEPTLVFIDLSRLVSISPSALALLTAAIHSAGTNGLMAASSKIVPPNSPGTRVYLQRMNLLRSIPGFAHVEEEFERHEESGFRGCLRFVDDSDYWKIAAELTDALCERCATDEVAKAAVRVCLDEIAENVVHHAEAPAGFAAAQGWRRTNEFEIAIVDLGVGIKASLTKNQTYKHITDDTTAIQTALQAQVTSTPERNAGIGLFITKMVLKANGGSLYVRSGLGAVYAGEEDQADETEVAMPGTIVALRARTDMPFDLNAAYDRLEPINDF